MNQIPAKPAPFVANVDPSFASKMIEDLQNQGFVITQPAYTLFQAKKIGITCTFYTSGKLVVQGKESPAFIEYYLEPEILKAFTYTYSELLVDYTPRIGVDEAGKGDFFGPLCIAGVYAGEAEIRALLEIGVKDSKTLSDVQIVKLASQIKRLTAHHIIAISPFKYNQLYESFKNLNLLLAWGHATAIETLVSKTGCRTALIDQFSKDALVERALKQKNIAMQLTQRTKAESDPVVAAASILARAAFVEGIAKLSTEIEFELPKGASSQVLVAGKQLLIKFGLSVFDKCAKKHFKTLDQIQME